MKQIVILGGGFTGLEVAITARKLSNHEITLIDHSPVMTFHGHLHEIVSERITPEEIEIDLNDSLNKRKINFLQAEFQGIKKGYVQTDKKKIPYDVLIIAMGSKTCFSIKGMKNCDELKTSKQARMLHEHLMNLDKARIAIVGAGLTGTELVFEIDYLGKKYDKNFIIHLIEASSGPMPHFPQKAVDIVKNNLEEKDIVQHYNNKILKCNPKELIFDNGTKLDYDLLIWTAGIEPVANAKAYGLKTTHGFIKVNEQLRTSENNIFAIGDIAWIGKESHELWNAMTAIKEGKTAGINAVNYLENKPLINYELDKEHLFLVSLGNRTGLYIKDQKVKAGKIPLLMKSNLRKKYLKERR